MLEMFSLKQFKESFKSEYELIRWVVFVFIGGAVNYLSIHSIGNFIVNQLGQLQILQNTQSNLVMKLFQANQTQHQIIQTQLQNAQQATYQISALIASLAIFLYFVPILLSILLTITSSEKRIIPPVFMQIIAFGSFILFSTHSATPPEEKFVFLYMMLVYVIFGGLTQDRILIRLVGQSVERDSMKRFSILVPTKMKDLEAILVKDYYKNRLFLGKIEEISDGIRIHSDKSSKFKITMDLVNTENHNETIVNMVIFDQGWYYFKKSEDLNQFARGEYVNLEDILKEQSVSMHVKPLPENTADYLVNSIVESVSGISAHVKQMSKIGWFKVGMFVIALVIVGIIYFTLKDTTNTVIALILIVLYLAFELPARFGKLRR